MSTVGWLLFYSFFCLDGILSNIYLQHFALLIEGVHIILGEDININKLAQARNVFEQFYKVFPFVYGMEISFNHWIHEKHLSHSKI